jgi:hypothetical protein
MSKETAILGKLFAAFDAGYYDLPQDLLARRRAEKRVNDALTALNQQLIDNNPADARTKVVADLIAVAGKSGVPDSYERPFMEAQDVTRRLAAQQSILSEARGELAERTPWFAARLSEEILSDYLRPAMEKVLERVRPGADLATRMPWDDQRALVMADRKVRDYHELVAKAHDDYIQIRSAQHRLMTLTGQPRDDAFHMLGELRNMHLIWPTRDSGVPSIKGQAPWPEGIARMVWLVTSEAEPWMPTAAEANAALQERIDANPIKRGGVLAGASA